MLKRQGRLSQADIDARVKKILAAKYWLGLDRRQQVSYQNLYEDLNRPQLQRLNQRLADASVTLLKSDYTINSLDYAKRTAIVGIGYTALSEFQRLLGERFTNHLSFMLSANASADDVAAVADELANYDQVIVAIHDTRVRPGSTLGYNGTVRLFINQLAEMNSVFCVFANPYALAGLPGVEQAKSLLICYQNDVVMQRAAAKVVLRQLNPSGRLPVTINSFFRYGDGE